MKTTRKILAVVALALCSHIAFSQTDTSNKNTNTNNPQQGEMIPTPKPMPQTQMNTGVPQPMPNTVPDGNVIPMPTQTEPVRPQSPQQKPKK